MLKNEEPHQKSRRRNRQDQDDRVRITEAEPHQRPQQAEWNDRHSQLEQAPPELGLTERSRHPTKADRSRGRFRRTCYEMLCRRGRERYCGDQAELPATLESAENPALSVKSPVVEERLGVNLDLIRMFERSFEWISAPKNEVGPCLPLNLRPEML